MKQVFENGVSKWPKYDGRFPVLSGVKFKFDSTREPGDRITELTDANGVPIDPDKKYTLATNDFVAGGKDGYRAMLDPEVETLLDGEETQTI